MLNIVWGVMIVASLIVALLQTFLAGDSELLSATIGAAYDMGKVSVNIAIGLIGLLSLWLGFFKLAEAVGITEVIAKALRPLLCRLMPDVPPNHPAHSAITLNLSANLLGLDNAATPFGIKAMESLQSLNPVKQVASNAQILFLVINTSSVTLIPVTIFLYRAQQGAAEPALVFLPILLATCVSTLVGILTVSFMQRLNLLQPVILLYGAVFATLMALVIGLGVQMSSEQLEHYSALLGNGLIGLFLLVCLVAGFRKKIDAYSLFISGAKEGFGTAVHLIPYLVAMLVALGMFRASGCLELFTDGIGFLLSSVGLNTDFIPVLSTAFMKPFSGSGARAMLIETMQHYGVDSFPALVAASIQGSTETTFYVLAVYFGAVGIKKVRHAIVCGLAADLAGIITAIFAAYYFFH